MACLIFSMDISFLPCILVLFSRPFCLVPFGQYCFSKSKAHADAALVIKGYHLKCSVSGNLRRHYAFDLPRLSSVRAISGLPESRQSMETWGWSFEAGQGELGDLSFPAWPGREWRPHPSGGAEQQRGVGKGHSSHQAVCRSPQLIYPRRSPQLIYPRFTVGSWKSRSGCSMLCCAPRVYLVWCDSVEKIGVGESYPSNEHWSCASIVHIKCFCTLFWTHKNFSIKKGNNKYRWQGKTLSLPPSFLHTGKSCHW